MELALAPEKTKKGEEERLSVRTAEAKNNAAAPGATCPEAFSDPGHNWGTDSAPLAIEGESTAAGNGPALPTTTDTAHHSSPDEDKINNKAVAADNGPALLTTTDTVHHSCPDKINNNKAAAAADGPANSESRRGSNRGCRLPRRPCRQRRQHRHLHLPKEETLRHRSRSLRRHRRPQQQDPQSFGRNSARSSTIRLRRRKNRPGEIGRSSSSSSLP